MPDGRQGSIYQRVDGIYHSADNVFIRGYLACIHQRIERVSESGSRQDMFIRGMALCVYQRVHRICLPECTECLITTRRKGSDFKTVPRSNYQKVDMV